MEHSKPKFKVGDKVIICQDLITTITQVQDEPDGHYVYWFKDEKGADKWEMEHAIEYLHNCKIKHHDSNRIT